MKVTDALRERICDELNDVPVPVTLDFGRWLNVTDKLYICGCMECMQIADGVVDAMSSAVMAAELSPAVSSTVDQALTHQRFNFRVAFITRLLCSRLMPTPPEDATVFERVEAACQQFVNGHDLSVPLADLRQAAEEFATSQAATWGIDRD